MRLWILIPAVAGLLALANPAGAKYVSESLRIDGPGIDSPGVIESRRVIDDVYSATLVGRQRERTARPAEPGPAFLLEFTFGVDDEDGARTETVNQILHPFAQEGPLVLTPPGQGFDMSYGPIRFRPGWFAIPAKVQRILEDRGLPRAVSLGAQQERADARQSSGFMATGANGRGCGGGSAPSARRPAEMDALSRRFSPIAEDHRAGLVRARGAMA
jgi:hypothetical protein